MTSRPCGLLLADKPVGPSSFAVVARVRKLAHERQVGHCGTLDPLASGLLPVLVGEATKLAHYLVGLDKEYVATARLGASSDTYDAEGRLSPVAGSDSTLAALSEDDVRRALARFVGRIRQRPPAYSAIKKDGVRLYQLARADVAVEADEREVVVHGIALDGFAPPEVRFTVRCGKGTYIRSIAHDLGQALAVGAHLTALRRTRIGPFDVATACDPFAVEALPPLASLASAVTHLPAIEVDAAAAARLRLGQQAPLAVAPTPPGAPSVRVMCDGELVAIAEADPASGRLTLARVFASSAPRA